MRMCGNISIQTKNYNQTKNPSQIPYNIHISASRPVLLSTPKDYKLGWQRLWCRGWRDPAVTHIFDVVHLFFQLIGGPPVHHHFFLLIWIWSSHHAIDNTLRKFPDLFSIAQVRRLKEDRKGEKNNDSLSFRKTSVTITHYAWYAVCDHQVGQEKSLTKGSVVWKSPPQSLHSKLCMAQTESAFTLEMSPFLQLLSKSSSWGRRNSTIVKVLALHTDNPV